MANNITAPGRGSVIATQQIGDTHYPVSKIAVDGSTLVSDASPFPVRPDGVADGAVQTLTSGTAISCTGYGNVALQVTGISGTVTVSGSIDGTNYVALTGVNVSDFSSAETVTANGIYSYPALAYIKFTGTGTVKALLKR